MVSYIYTLNGVALVLRVEKDFTSPDLFTERSHPTSSLKNEQSRDHFRKAQTSAFILPTR